MFATAQNNLHRRGLAGPATAQEIALEPRRFDDPTPTASSDPVGLPSDTPLAEQLIVEDVGDHVTYPEGGYGWVVTAAAFILLFQYLGIFYAWGVIQGELSQAGLANSFQLSFIGATSAFFLAFGCLPAAWLLGKIGPRWTAFSGAMGASVCLVLAGFSLDNLIGMIFLQGFAFGSSISLVYLTAYTIPSQWFMKKRGLSTGIASAGGGIGGAIWSIAIERLIAEWGLAWTFRFLGAMSLVVGGASAIALKPGVSLDRPASEANRTARPEKGLIRSSRFIRVLVSCFIASYPFLIPPYISISANTASLLGSMLYRTLTPAQSVGLSASQGALYTALFNVASGFGRIAFGLLADEAVGNINSWLCSLFVIALSSLTIWVNATDQALIILFVLFCGAGSGGFFSLQTSVVAQILGSHRLNKGIAWLEVAESFGYFAGPISAGALLDAFGGTQQGAGPYKPAIFLVGGTTALAVLIVVSIRYSSSKVLWVRI